jgi:SAM-dependent methyltransferase
MPEGSSANSGQDGTSARARLQAWFNRPLGLYLLDREQAILDRILPDLFGYHFMQIGLLGKDRFLNSTRISHHIVAQLEEEGDLQQGVSLRCGQDHLPIAPDSMDVVLLPHVLEYSPNPHKLLREVERILIGEGHLIIIGFNPWSLCGIWRLLLAWRDEPPWSGHFFSFTRIKDWFSLLDFEVVRKERFFYLPPLANLNLVRKLKFLEKLGNYCWSVFGGIYIIVVKKRVVPLTSIKVIWHKRRSMIEAGIAEPTARRQGNGG